MELKPCPFCGSADIRIGFVDDWSDERAARCPKCEALGPPSLGGDAGAANLWNGRAEAQEPQR